MESPLSLPHTYGFGPGNPHGAPGPPGLLPRRGEVEALGLLLAPAFSSSSITMTPRPRPTVGQALTIALSSLHPFTPTHLILTTILASRYLIVPISQRKTLSLMEIGGLLEVTQLE